MTRLPASLDEDRLRAVFRALVEHGVEYAVFGAVALGLHGLARATADLDLFIAPTPDNVERLKAVSTASTPACSPSASVSRKTDMPVARYRSVEEMPPPWRAADDSDNLRAVAMMMALYRRLQPRRDHRPGVRRFRSILEANADRDDPYRTERVTVVAGG